MERLYCIIQTGLKSNHNYPYKRETQQITPTHTCAHMLTHMHTHAEEETVMFKKSRERLENSDPEDQNDADTAKECWQPTEAG